MIRSKQILAGLLIAAMLPATAQAAMAATPDYMTRGEVAGVLLAAADDYHQGLKKTDILKGYRDGSLHEEKPVTRAQALVMLRRAFGGDLPTPEGDNARSGYSSTHFKDIPTWAKEDLTDVLSTGIVAGTTQTTFSPNSYITQRQMDLFIQRVYALEGSNLKDDFYATVNKKALDSSVIKPGFIAAGNFNELGITVSEQVAQIIKEIASSPKTEGEKKISVLYHNILNMDARNKAGITPIQPYLDAIDQAKTLDELMKVHAKASQDLGMHLLLAFGLSINAKDSTRYDLTFGSIAPPLGQSGYINATAAQKNAYLTYLSDLFQLTGLTAVNANAKAKVIWDADAAIASKSLTMQEHGDVDKTYNLFTMEQLQDLFPNVDLVEILRQSGYQKADQIVVSDVGALKECAKLFSDKNLDVLKTYCHFGLVASYAPMLSQDFVDTNNRFQQSYMGVIGSLSDEQVAAQYVQALMSDYLGKAYVDRHFSAAAKADVEKMVKDMIAVYKGRIRNLTWMSDVTKTKALRKLDTMVLHIGYPDTWSDDLADTQFLSVAQGGSFFDNVVAMNAAYHKLQVASQQNGVDKSAWALTPDTVNACYDATVNSITFPAAILQPPFYDVDATYEQNLGRIGYVIAHEITHAFDNNGAKYDENGNAADWWTKEDYSAFQKLCNQVVELYDGKEVAPGITCNGELTLSENIADLGAIACITELESKRANPNYQALYTAAAEIWYSSYTREMRQLLVQTDLHAPDKLRGSLVLQNFQQFYDAFGITEEDGMWLDPAERVVIW